MNRPHGFTLIMSVAIMGTVLMLAAISSTRLLLQQLSSTVGLEDYVSAKYLAEGCADVALLRLRQDAGYLGNENVFIGGESCAILPMSVEGPETVIKTEAEVRSRIYRLRVGLSSTDPLTVVSWDRVPSF